jgi:ribonucleoside-diphosphate reductase alpha chain
MITCIRKRDGQIVPFEKQKITDAIYRALFDAKIKDGKKAKKLSDKVVEILNKKFVGQIPNVEDIQNVVENVLFDWNKRVGQLYSEFRAKKAAIRQARRQFRIEEKLTYNAMTVLEQRYLLRDENGKIIESPGEMFRRVARTVAAVEQKYGGDPDKIEEEFFDMMSKLEFLPNSPTLFNAGTPLGQLSACFVIPIDDSLNSIFDAVKATALIEQSGGGVGFSFSKLRPKGDIVRSTMGVASGPVSFMRIFDTVTDVIKAGGKRRGAMMGILRADHPDIEEFITSKLDPKMLRNFNISVAITDKFMHAVQKNALYDLVNPRTGDVVKTVRARDIWNLIIKTAWQTGDPGIIFIDEINRKNPTSHIGSIESTNPCGEQPLHPYESCNLGSINLTKILKRINGKYLIDWQALERITSLAVRFLDNVIDINKYPLPEIESITKANRRIGLGVMGWADMLIMLGIPYNSNRALNLAEKLMSFISKVARATSAQLGRERGSFPNFIRSLWYERGWDAMRNATVTTIAPTGSISIIAGVSSGIEPIFAISYGRKILGGRVLLEVNRIFEQIAKEQGWYSAQLMLKIARTGSVQRIAKIPKKIQRLFITAFDISPEWHVRMQAAFQKYTDNAVSKTINFPKNASIEDVKRAFNLAYKLKCKGITIYRYGSKPEQVLYIGPEYVQAESEYAGGCPTSLCPMP